MSDSKKNDSVLMIPLEFYVNFSIRKMQQSAEYIKINADYLQSMVKQFIEESSPSEEDKATIERWNEVIDLLNGASSLSDKVWNNLEKTKDYYIICKNGHYLPDNLTWENRK